MGGWVVGWVVGWMRGGWLGSMHILCALDRPTDRVLWVRENAPVVGAILGVRERVRGFVIFVYCAWRCVDVCMVWVRDVVMSACSSQYLRMS
jgi:hypothetical protein